MTDHDPVPPSPAETLKAIRAKLEHVEEASRNGELNVFEQAHHASWADIEYLLTLVEAMRAEPPPVVPAPPAETLRVHKLKTWPEYFIALLDGSKTFEFRRDDRGFAVGPSWQRELARLGACEDARVWARPYRTFAAAWAACPHGEWLLWYLKRAVPNTREHRENFVLIAIKTVLAVPNRQPIPAWDAWADRLAEPAWAAWADIVREYYPTPPRPSRTRKAASARRRGNL